MDSPKNLQIPPTIEECIYLMRSYVYIDKYNMEVQIREISPFLAPGFVLGVCAQIPFLCDFVKSYIRDVGLGKVYEVQISDCYHIELTRNNYINSQFFSYEYTQSDCSFILSVILNTIVQSMYGRENLDFLHLVDHTVKRISQMANMQPMTIYFPKTFRHIMKNALCGAPELRIDMMSLLCTNSFRSPGIWSMIKRFIWLPIRNYQMSTFFAINQWYESNEKTFAHVDSDIVDEMKKYEEVLEEMTSIAKYKGYNLGAFRIMNPNSMLPYLRQFPCSVYCAIEWKKSIDPSWSSYQYNLNRFGIDTQYLDRMMSIPVKYTLKRRLKEDEIQRIAAKRFKVLEVSTIDENGNMKDFADDESI